MLTDKIRTLVEKHYNTGVKICHAIHMYPETAFEEYKTSGLIADTLEANGIETQRGVAKTGVVAIVRGAKPGKTVLLRADMDALELTEEADVPYKSQRPGFMHGCGHDGHAAGLVLSALVLNELKDELYGNVKFMFQPAEESVGGAKPMIDEGVLENPKVDAAFACHLWGSLVEGEVYVKSGPVMASPDEFQIKLTGRGGHGAMPHLSVDPVVMAAQVINDFQVILSRRKNPIEPAVISVCSIHGGDTHNVIPTEVTMCGTIRTFSQEMRKWIPTAMDNVLVGVAQASGGTYNFEVFERFLPVINDERMTELVRKASSKIVGADKVRTMPEPNMGGEDFAYLCMNVPSSFFFVGIAEALDKPVLHHNPYFKWNDAVLKISSGCLCQVAVDFLNREPEA